MSLSIEVVSTTISKIFRRGKTSKAAKAEEIEKPYVRGEIPEKLYPAEAFRVDVYFKPWMGLR